MYVLSKYGKFFRDSRSMRTKMCLVSFVRKTLILGRLAVVRPKLRSVVEVPHTLHVVRLLDTSRRLREYTHNSKSTEKRFLRKNPADIRRIPLRASMWQLSMRWPCAQQGPTILGHYKTYALYMYTCTRSMFRADETKVPTWITDENASQVFPQDAFSRAQDFVPVLVLW